MIKHDSNASVPVTEQFVQFYYQTFDSDRQTLAGLYV